LIKTQISKHEEIISTTTSETTFTASEEAIASGTIEQSLSRQAQIKAVTYHRLKNLGNYENERLEATAAIHEGDSPVEVLLDIKQWVSNQLNLKEDIRGEIRDLQHRKSTLNSEIFGLEARLAELKTKWLEAKKVLAAHGIEVTELLWFEEQPEPTLPEPEAIVEPESIAVIPYEDDDDRDHEDWDYEDTDEDEGF
jgi:chromosome segregation ATPase